MGAALAPTRTPRRQRHDQLQLVTVTARLTQAHGEDETAYPDDGCLVLTPIAHGVHEGALRGVGEVRTPIEHGVAAPVEVVPGCWRVRVHPRHGRAWEPWTAHLVDDQAGPGHLFYASKSSTVPTSTPGTSCTARATTCRHHRADTYPGRPGCAARISLVV